jgi:hypothetical protein
MHAWKFRSLRAPVALHFDACYCYVMLYNNSETRQKCNEDAFEMTALYDITVPTMTSFGGGSTHDGIELHSIQLRLFHK